MSEDLKSVLERLGALEKSVESLTEELATIPRPTRALSPPSPWGERPKQPACRSCGSYACPGCTPPAPAPRVGPHVIPMRPDLPSERVVKTAFLGGGQAKVFYADGSEATIGPDGRRIG